MRMTGFGTTMSGIDPTRSDPCDRRTTCETWTGTSLSSSLELIWLSQTRARELFSCDRLVWQYRHLLFLHFNEVVEPDAMMLECREGFLENIVLGRLKKFLHKGVNGSPSPA